MSPSAANYLANQAKVITPFYTRGRLYIDPDEAHANRLISSVRSAQVCFSLSPVLTTPSPQRRATVEMLMARMQSFGILKGTFSNAMLPRLQLIATVVCAELNRYYTYSLYPTAQGVYDEDGNMLTGSMMDYPLPTAADLPSFELDRTVTPTDVNPMGVKGIGEAGTIGSAHTLVNAVVDALSPLGVKHIDMPMRPKRVWQAIQDASK